MKMGLLDAYLPEDPEKRAAVNMGLLNFGAAMLANADRGFGAALGTGLLGGAHGYQDAYKNGIELRQRQQQLDWTKQVMGEMSGAGSVAPSDSLIGQQALAIGARSGSIGPTVENAQRFDQIKAMTPRPPSSGISLRTLQQGALLGMKNIDPLFNMYKYQNDGAERKPGTFYENPMTGEMRYIQDPKSGVTYDAGTNSVSPIAGFNENQVALEGAKEGAKEAAKSRYQLLPLGYVDQGGRPLGGTVGDYVDSFRNPSAPAVQSGAPSGKREGLDVSRLTPQQQAYLLRQDPEAFTRGVERYAGGPPVLQSKAEERQQLGKIELTQGAQGDLNKNWITSTLNPVQDAGNAAKQMLSQLDVIKAISFKTGWNAEAKANAANVLASMGVKDAEKYATNAQVFQQVVMDRNMTMLAAQKGPQTEGDSQRAQQTFVMLKNTPRANEFIADFSRANANMAAKRAAFYAEALPLAQQQGDLTEIDRRWAKVAGSIWDDPALSKYKGKK